MLRFADDNAIITGRVEDLRRNQSSHNVTEIEQTGDGTEQRKA